MTIKHRINLAFTAFVLFMLAFHTSYASTPMWTFTPLSPTTLSVANEGTATVQYRVTNQSKKTFTLAMIPIVGITPDTTAGFCTSPFTLASGQSCQLLLYISGSELTKNVEEGPVVCDQGNPLQCYQPSTNDRLNITYLGDELFTVGGNITGLGSSNTLVLQNDGATLSTRSDGAFTFSNKLPPNTPYDVTVNTQPGAQICSVSSGTGTISNSDVTNVVVTCAETAYSIGGTFSGLATGETVVLQVNGTDTLTLTSNSPNPFVFSTQIANGSPYLVTVLTQTAPLTCSVSNASGTVSGANVTNVQVACGNASTLGGRVYGLVDGRQVTLANNGANLTTVTGTSSSPVAFTFSTPVVQQSPYAVTIQTQPLDQTCSFIGGTGTGTMPAHDTSPVIVNCVSNNTTLTIPATGFIPVNSTDDRQAFTVTNSGPNTATGVHLQLPQSNVVQDASACETLLPTASCNIFLSSPQAYPPRGGIVVTGDNITSTTPATTALAFYFGQGPGVTTAKYLVFEALSATQANVVDTVDSGPTTPFLIPWANSDDNLNINQYTTNPPYTCEGNTDGACDSGVIYNAFGSSSGTYAELSCYQNVDDGATQGDWYLPAICQLGNYDGSANAGGLNADGNCGTNPIPSIENLILLGFMQDMIGAEGQIFTVYWSSTEFYGSYPPPPPGTGGSVSYAFAQQFDTGNQYTNVFENKGSPYVLTRCVRTITY